MYFFYIMLIGFIYAWWKTKTLKPVKEFTVEMTFKGTTPLILMLLMHIFATMSYGDIPITVSNSLHVASIAMTMWFIWMNRDLFKGTSFLLMGTLMNLVVIAFNKGRMPVSTEYMRWYGGESKVQSIVNGDVPFYIDLNTETWFPYLADIIPMFNPSIAPGLLSVGDVFICIGVFIAVQGMFNHKK